MTPAKRVDIHGRRTAPTGQQRTDPQTVQQPQCVGMRYRWAGHHPVGEQFHHRPTGGDDHERAEGRRHARSRPRPPRRRRSSARHARPAQATAPSRCTRRATPLRRPVPVPPRRHRSYAVHQQFSAPPDSPSHRRPPAPRPATGPCAMTRRARRSRPVTRTDPAPRQSAPAIGSGAAGAPRAPRCRGAAASGPDDPAPPSRCGCLREPESRCTAGDPRWRRRWPTARRPAPPAGRRCAAQRRVSRRHRRCRRHTR